MDSLEVGAEDARSIAAQERVRSMELAAREQRVDTDEKNPVEQPEK